ncbi:hypothetical protein LINPERPRIM_LOCUS25199, partial [Linum perenne]
MSLMEKKSFEKDGGNLCKSRHRLFDRPKVISILMGTSKVRRLEDSYTFRDEKVTTMKSKIRGKSVSHTPAVDIIDLEEDSSYLVSK